MCLVVASDGLWDVVMDMNAMGLVEHAVHTTSPTGATEWLPSTAGAMSAAEALVAEATDKQSGDNITAIVVAFKLEAAPYSEGWFSSKGKGGQDIGKSL